MIRKRSLRFASVEMEARSPPNQEDATSQGETEIVGSGSPRLQILKRR